MALLLALLVLIILVLLVGQMVITAGHNRATARNATADLANSYGAKAGYHQARLYLEADFERGQDVDSVNEGWAKPIEFALGQARVRVTVEDAASKINVAQVVNDKGELNETVYDELRRLLANLGHGEEPALRILDYQDADTRGDFESGARNERMTTLDELERIDGIPREVLYGDDTRRGILPFVTVWPGEPVPGFTPGIVNANTAPVEVLSALDDDMTAPIAASIVDARSRQAQDGSYQHFKNVGDLASVPGMTQPLLARITPRLTVKAPAFEIHARSAVGGLEKAWLYVVKREKQGERLAFTLLHQQRENEARSVKPPEESSQ